MLRSDSDGQLFGAWCIHGLCLLDLQILLHSSMRYLCTSSRGLNCPYREMDSAVCCKTPGSLNHSWMLYSGRLMIRKQRGIDVPTRKLMWSKIWHWFSVPKHSSRPSIMTRYFNVVGCSDAAWSAANAINGWMISLWSWMGIIRWMMAGSSARTFWIWGCNLGMDRRSWYAKVAKSGSMELRLGLPREKKKLPPKIWHSAYCSAIVWAIADFPDPAGPCSQIIGLSPLSISAVSCLRTSTRVPGWHFGGGCLSCESNAAPGEVPSKSRLSPVTL